MAYKDKGFYARKHQALIGQKFNRLTILDIWQDPKKLYYMCRYQCDCGTVKEARLTYVKNGHLKSCGCLKYIHSAQPTKDDAVGKNKHPLYHAWASMMSRCYHKSSTAYYLYGGRGIKVCDDWRNFWNFVKWSDSVGGRPDGYTLDRIDVNGNYCPENCRWASVEVQQNNKRTNHHLTYNGETLTLSQWSRKLGLSRYAIQYRFMQGWTAEDILTIPLNYRKKDYHKKILQKDINGNIVATYKGLFDLPKEYRAAPVSSVCCGNYPRSTYKGYIWEYAAG